MEAKTTGVVAVTGIGSMPGTDSAEATRIVAGELSVPHIVELPARGPGGDVIGRTLGLLNAVTGEFAGETTPSGWRLSGSRAGGDPGRQMRRAASWLAEDADHLEQSLEGFTGRVKVQVAGPWTLAASVESARGTRILADSGACADLAAAVAEALGAQIAEVARRIPGATVVVQVDEPMLPIVVSGGVRTPSGRGAIRTPPPAELLAVLAAPVRVANGLGGVAAAHCCARQVPFELFRRAGFDAISVDPDVLGTGADEALGTWWQSGGTVVLGVAPAVDRARVTPESLARSVSGTWRRIGFGVEAVGSRTWLSPTCGLAGASPGWARSVGGLMRKAAALLESAE
ncbi:MAG: methionine synthase [Candidatus Nanopelagicales bacterium]